MYDIERARFSERFEMPILAGQTIAEEGQLLTLVDDGAGNGVVRPSQGNVAPFTLQLANGNLNVGGVAPPNYMMSVYDHTAAAYLAQVAGAPAGAQYQPTAAGLLTFNLAEHDHVITVNYLYTLTVDQILLKFHQQPVSFQAQNYFGVVGVGGGYGVIYTTCYNPAAVDGGGVGWETQLAGVGVSSGPGGRLVLTGGATAGVAVGRMIKRPTHDDPWLGVEFSIVP
jgi:hypothetical protein